MSAGEANEGRREPRWERWREEQVLRWQAGDRPLVEKLLAEHGLDHASLDDPTDGDGLLDVIYSEVLLREEVGETPDVEEYVRRFPALAEPLRRQFAVHAAWPRESPREVSPWPAAPGYEITGILGRGGMGVVFRARHEALKRTVALKMLRDRALADDASRSRFRAEAEAVARLQHPHIVQIHDYGEADGCPYLSLEYVAGGTLESWVCEPLRPVREVVEMVEKVARAVGFAHSQGIVHRDLKPANVLLAGSEPKVADFGLAKQLAADGALTQSAAILGTGAYMSPEQAWGKSRDVGPATDVHALGVLLYELLVGVSPFRDESLITTLDRVRFETPRAPSERRPDVPAWLDAICLHCLAKSPTERYSNGDQLADDLGRFLAGVEPEAAKASLGEVAPRRSSGVAERGRGKWVVVAAAAAVSAAAIAAVLFLAPPRRPSADGESVGDAVARAALEPRTVPTTFALLIGVRTYEFDEQRVDLAYTESDVDELSRLLWKRGVPRENIRLLTQWSQADNPSLAPTAENIRRQMREFLANCIAGDTVWVAITGMGGESGGEHVYGYLPADARLDDEATLLSLTELYGLLAECRAERKVLMVDTCQTTDLPEWGWKSMEPPQGVAALFACSPREASFEHAELRHGVFSYQVLRGLEGAADLDGDGQISIGELHAYARRGVVEFLSAHLPEAAQTPLLLSQLSKTTPVGQASSLSPPPPHTRNLFPPP